MVGFIRVILYVHSYRSLKTKSNHQENLNNINLVILVTTKSLNLKLWMYRGILEKGSNDVVRAVCYTTN